jgi:hypothetical protein
MVLSVEGKELVMIEPSPELPDDMPIASLELPPKVRQAPVTAGLRTVGEIREKPDAELLQIQNPFLFATCAQSNRPAFGGLY